MEIHEHLNVISLDRGTEEALVSLYLSNPTYDVNISCARRKICGYAYHAFMVLYRLQNPLRSLAYACVLCVHTERETCIF